MDRRGVKGRSGRKGAALTKQQFTSMLNARREMKYFTDNDTTTCAADGAVSPISQPIIIGDTADARDGSQINVKKIDLNLTIVLGASSVVDTVRFIVFADSQAVGTYPAVTDVLTSGDPNAMLSRTVKVEQRFKILYDTILTLSNVGSNAIVVHRKSINLGNHTVFYRGTTSVESANGRGAIYYLICGDVSTNLSVYNLDWAISYYDS